MPGLLCRYSLVLCPHLRRELNSDTHSSNVSILFFSSTGTEAHHVHDC